VFGYEQFTIVLFIFQFQKVNLLKSIEEEQESILDLKIQIKLAQRKHMVIA